MEITLKIEAPGLMEAILALAEQLQNHNAIIAGNPTPSAPITPIAAVIENPLTPAPLPPVQPTPIQTAPPVAPSVVPTVQPPSYTQQDLAMACVQLMDLKGQARIMEIMAQFGVQALTQLDKSQYGALAQVLRNEGVNI